MSIENGPILVCDVCGKRVLLHRGPDGEFHLPEGWEAVRVHGWIGSFHGCCAKHALEVSVAADFSHDPS